MSKLAGHLKDLIRSQGPIPVSVYMGECLANREHGYYMERDPLGAAGDFTTAPEISQMFGELIGLWCAAVWQSMGSPASVSLVELGPGRGTLMADALRATRAVPPFSDALSVHLVETSPVLRQKQKDALREVRVAWHESVSSIPDGPVIVVANEFFDALPIRQFVRRSDGWHERLVGFSDDSDLQFQISPLTTSLPSDQPIPFDDAPQDAIVEICPAGRTIARDIGIRVAKYPGAALIIDYGPLQTAPGDSLQAVKDHQYHDVLESPGDADITAHVDFQSLSRAAQDGGAVASGVITQSAFLDSLGIRHRADRLKTSATSRQRADIDAALQRLTSPHAMGHLFKAMSICHPDLSKPPGFEDPSLWP